MASGEGVWETWYAAVPGVAGRKRRERNASGSGMCRTQGLIAFVRSYGGTTAILILHLLCYAVPLSRPPPHMGRTTTKSVSRVYADVNSKLGQSWYEYGRVPFLL